MALQERKKKQKRKKRAIRISVILVIVLLFVAVMLTVFRTETILVEGNEIYDDATIRRTVLATEHSEYTWFLWGKYKWFQKESIPFVDEMEITFNSPSSLTVTVYEKATIGCFYEESTGLYHYFDKEGFVIEQSKNLLPDAVEVVGIDVEAPTLYEAMDLEDQDILSYVLTLTQCLDKYGLKTQKILVGDYGKVDMILGDVRVKMGKNTLTEEKVMRIAAISDDLFRRSGVLDLEDWENDSGSLIFKTESKTQDASGDAVESTEKSDE